MKLCLTLILLAFSGALVTAAPESETVSQKPTTHQKIYSFQHRILPKWTHQTNGAFYKDLRAGLPAQLVEAAREVVGSDFAKQMAATNVTTPEGVLVTFSEPPDAPLCFFVFIMKTEQGFRYLTLEKSIDIAEDGTKSALCEWAKAGQHKYYGSRNYTDSKNFLADVTTLLQRPEKSASGSVPPAATP
jgi:hypothetical protein